MPEPLISVIVPVYNNEKYLPKCLESILCQTYENIEVICINDGSVDNSLQILKNYAAKDSRIRIFNQENRGQSAARNRGINVARGKYITFVDSDDWLLLTLYQDFVDITRGINPDIFCFNGEYYSEIPDITMIKKFYDINVWKNHITDRTIHNFHDCMKPFTGNMSICNKIYRKQFILSNSISFIENKTFEDTLFQVQTFFTAKSIIVVPDVYYKYRDSNTSSIMHTLGNNAYDIFYILEKISEIITRKELYNELKYAFFQFVYSILHNIYIQLKPELKSNFYIESKKYLSGFNLESFDTNILNRLNNIQLYKLWISLPENEYKTHLNIQ